MRPALAVICVLLSIAAAPAADWPQWLGPNRDGVWPEVGVADALPAGGPRVKWRAAVGGGYSGPAVADGRVFVTDFMVATGKITNDPGTRDALTGQERTLAFDAETGKPLWTHSDEREYKISYPSGPRCTPTVDGDRVYTQGAQGHLLCLNAADGTVIWRRDLVREYKADVPIWGFASHPLIDGDKLITIVGGKGSVAVALDKKTGKEIWRALSAKEPGYSSPVIHEVDGVRHLFIWHAEALASLDPETGAARWSVPLVPSYGMSIMVPRAEGRRVYVGAIVHKGMAVDIAPDGKSAKVAWKGDRNTGIYAKVDTPLLWDGHLYGVCMDGELRCAKLADGERLWEELGPTTGGKKANSGSAFLVRNADRVFLFGETGRLTIARLSPEGYKEVSAADILPPTNDVFGRKVVWSHPAFANRAMYARNDETLVCVDLSAK